MLVDRLDGDDVEFDAEIFGELLGVGDGMIGAVSAGHGDADDFVFAEGIDGEGGGERGIDSAGETEDDAFEAALADVVLQSEDEGFVDGFDALGVLVHFRATEVALPVGHIKIDDYQIFFESLLLAR